MTALDPDAQALIEVMRASGAAQPYELPLEQAREQARAALVARGSPIELHRVDDVALPVPHGPLPLRVYRPRAGVLPMALFLHGGGWTLNDLDTHDRLCRRIARRSGWLLAALDYRRAPEHPHPAALEDAVAAYRWLLDNASSLQGDLARVALVGESSGATTAACLALLLRDQGAPRPLMLALAYPMADADVSRPSYAQHGRGYTLDSEFVGWSLANCLAAGHDLDAPYLLPLKCDLSGLPATFLMTAEFDPLRDEGLAFARELADAGVAVEHLHARDQMHGFLLLDRAIPKAGPLIDRLADALAQAG